MIWPNGWWNLFRITDVDIQLAVILFQTNDLVYPDITRLHLLNIKRFLLSFRLRVLFAKLRSDILPQMTTGCATSLLVAPCLTAGSIRFSNCLELLGSGLMSTVKRWDQIVMSSIIEYNVQKGEIQHFAKQRGSLEEHNSGQSSVWS